MVVSVMFRCKKDSIFQLRNILRKRKCKVINLRISPACCYSTGNRCSQAPVNGSHFQIKIEEKKKSYQYGILPSWATDYRHTLLAYIDVCIHIDELDSAHTVLMAYSPDNLSYREIKDPHLDAKLFTHLMHAWAKKGEFEKIEGLQVLLETSNIAVVPQLFAAKLECLSRQNPINYSKVRKVFGEIEQKGFTLHSLFSHSTFKMDEKAKVLEVIQRVVPGFVPAKEEEEQSGYFSDLLKDLKLHHSAVKNIFTANLNVEHLQSKLETQLNLEMKGFQVVQSVEKLSSDDKMCENKRRLSYFFKMYYPIIRETFLEERQRLEDVIDPTQVSIIPFLKVLSPDQFIDLLIQETINFVSLSKYNRIVLHQLYQDVGDHIFGLYRVQSRLKQGIVKRVSQIYSQYLEYYTKPELSSQYHPEEYWNILCQRVDKNYILNNEDIGWPDALDIAIGRFVVNVLLKCLHVDINIFKKTNTVHMVPAFYLMYQGGVPHIIKPHPVLRKFLIRGSSDILSLAVHHTPMLIPPIPWFNTSYGGYLLSSMKLMTVLEQISFNQKALEENSSKKLRAYLDIVNQFGAVPWVINKQVLSVMLTLFRDSLGEKVGLPVHSQIFYYHAYKKLIRRSNISIYQKLKLQFGVHVNYINWKIILKKLSLANALSDEKFWLPHKMDFRGRIYSNCLLSYLGHDIDRGLLKLADGKMLGETGLDWLKINLVNLLGHRKKSSLPERLEFADKIIPCIMASADHPLKSDSWWMKTDKPWQVLACCIEITEALRCPDPTKYMSHLLVAQDGTTNMLQHYGALVRDSHIARLVNLEPSSRPQDFYHEIIPIIEHAVEQDSSQGQIRAKAASPFIQRKIIKLAAIPAMYGVKDCVSNMRNLLLRENPHISDMKIRSVANYLSDKITFCIKQEFPGIFKVQSWLRKCANEISHQRNIPLEWETPLGLLVCQPYFASRLDFDKISLDADDEAEIESPENKDKQEFPKIMKVDHTKQQNAFSTNYIHCLDACHMILTALHCLKEEVFFLAVHDSFLTNAASVDRMNTICRKQFVKLHNQPLLDNLSQQLIDKFDFTDSEMSSLETATAVRKKHLAINLKSVPDRGSFNIENVLQSVYFFS